MKKYILFELIYALIITVVFGSFFILTNVNIKHKINTENDAADIVCDGVCRIELKSCEIYNDKLLCSSDFSEGKNIQFDDSPDYTNYVTYRLFIKTVPGETYAFYSEKSDYALNVFASGKPVAKSGNVSDNSAEFIPVASGAEGYFTAEEEITEIIVQQANFNHKVHYNTNICLGPAGDIQRYSSMILIKDAGLFICLVTAAFINLGMYFFFEQKKRYLFLILLCIAAAVNYATPLLASFIFKNVSWYISHRIEYCSQIFISVFAVAYSDTVFTGYIRKFMKYALYVYCAFCMVFILVTPSVIYTGFSTAGAYILMLLLVPPIISLFISIIRNFSETEPYKKLILIGILIMFVFSLVDLFGLSSKTLNSIDTETGIVVFTFINTIALALDFKNTQRQLDETRMREQELIQTNETMMKLGSMRDAFLADLSHELKTPLTVISNMSALTSYQIQNGLTGEKTVSDLKTIENEAVRLGRMVDQLKRKTVTRFENSGEKTNNLSATLKYAAEFCEPLCTRNSNRITVECEEGISADISEDLVFHCLYNLISNATRHCKNNTIELCGSSSGDKAVIEVRDHGDGMTEEQMGNAFERGYSGDSGSGIGLALCRQITEDSGGSISLSDTPGGGLTVTIEFNRC